MTSPLRRASVALVAAGALLTAPSLAFAAGVSPASVSQEVEPGQTIHIAKTVSTPEIPPKPDIVFVVDSTGSMGGAIANVKAEMGNILTTVKTAQPDAQFAVTNYKDESDSAGLFQVNTDLTASDAAAQAAVDTLSAGGGGDAPEGQLNALWQVGDGGDAISFRTGSSRIVVWFGDQPGHDPSSGHTLADAVASLTADSVRVLAISVGANLLDSAGQATAIANATGGSFLSGIPADGLSDAILAGLSNLPAEVTATTTCEPGLTVSFDPALPQTVPSGTDLVLDETVTVAADAPQGSTLTCTTTFAINGADAGAGFEQTVSIDVKDVTDPTVACDAGVNPAGKTPPGWKQAGFFMATAADNLPGVTVTVTDNATGDSFGPYAPGTTFKLTQAPGSASQVEPFQGAVNWHFTFSGDATLTATDAAGNTATATCSVPPKQK